MKIFKQSTGHYDEKVNFVDNNNVFLGYDTGQSCSESAGWFVADAPQEQIIDRKEDDIPELDGFVFDTAYFKEVENPDVFDEGKMVIFRITKGDEEKFIHLFNCHNGYYGHGFQFKIGDGVLCKDGCL